MTSILQWLRAASDMFLAQRSTVQKEPVRKSRGHDFKPGRLIELSDGTRYKVQPNGSWVRTSLRRHEVR